MTIPMDRDTLPPGPGDELTIEERVRLIQNQVLDLKGAINQAFADLHVKLDHIADSVTANVKLIRDEVRHHSTRIHQLELANLNGEKQ